MYITCVRCIMHALLAVSALAACDLSPLTTKVLICRDSSEDSLSQRVQAVKPQPLWLSLSYSWLELYSELHVWAQWRIHEWRTATPHSTVPRGRTSYAIHVHDRSSHLHALLTAVTLLRAAI